MVQPSRWQQLEQQQFAEAQAVALHSVHLKAPVVPSLQPSHRISPERTHAASEPDDETQANLLRLVLDPEARELALVEAVGRIEFPAERGEG